MISLAQSIVDTNHNMEKNPIKTRGDVVDTFRKVATRTSAPAAWANAIAGFTKDLPLIAPLIPKAMRFTVDMNVTDAAFKMHKTPTETLLKALPFARPPFPVTWIEFKYPEDDVRSGWLIEETKEGLKVSTVHSSREMNHLPFFGAATQAIITEAGFKFVRQHDRARQDDAKHVEEEQQALKYQCSMALSFLLLMNSRSNILKVEESPEDFSRLNKHRRKNGIPDKMSNSTITFDLSRVLGKNQNMSEEEAARTMATSLVRGHFKIRQTGVFFWTPYIRNAVSEEAKAQAFTDGLNRDRNVVNTNTHQGLVLPGLGG